MQAHIERLATFAQHGQPKDYAASDMMRADLGVLIMQVIAQPASQTQALCEYCGGAGGVEDSDGKWHAPCHCQIQPASPVQAEPVGWLDPTNTDPAQSVTFKKDKHEKWPHIYKQPFYTHPPKVQASKTVEPVAEVTCRGVMVPANNQPKAPQ